MVGLVTPVMLNVGGMAYFIFAGFSLAALLSVRTSNPKIAPDNMLNLLHSIILPRDQGPGKFLLMHVLSHMANDCTDLGRNGCCVR